jgi:phosphomethylpyrimidine synthase
MCGPHFCSMKISRNIAEKYGDDMGAATGVGVGAGADVAGDAEISAGMLAKSEEFLASGAQVYLPLVD